jgi:hypothetical protein
MPKAAPDVLQERIEKDLGRSISIEVTDIVERIAQLKQVLADAVATRDILLKQLKDQPFMEFSQRQRYKKALPAYDAKIKRLRLDISASETISKMSKEDLENPTVTPHYQHYPTPTKPEKK